MRALILDTETTDSKDGEVIELAWVGISSGLELLAETFEQRYQPVKAIKWGALAAHHILPGELAGCPSSTTCELPPVDYIIGHNVDFDWEVLGKPDCNRICTLAMARKLWPNLDSHSLSALYYYINGANEQSRETLRSAHSAMTDVMLCHSVLLEILKETELKTMSQLYAYSEEARIPEIMPFGKYKGRPVAEVDRGWAQWYRKQADTDPYILMALSRYCR